jgi:hypothetical protein
VLVGNGGDHNNVIDDAVEYHIGKFSQKAFSGFFGNKLKSFGVGPDYLNGNKDFLMETGSEPADMLFVESDGAR